MATWPIGPNEDFQASLGNQCSHSGSLQRNQLFKPLKEIHMSIFVTDNVAVQRFAIALFNTQVGTDTMGQVETMIARNGVDATFNKFFKDSFGGQTTAAVAATIVANVGITGAGVAGAVAYVVAQLNAAAPDARGAAVASMLNAFAGMTADATYGAAATAWNADVAAATAYTGAANIAVDTLVTQYLTTGQDVLGGSSLSDLFVADLIGNTDSFQSGDRIEGGAGVDALDITFGDASTTAIIARTNGVEIISVRSQANNTDGNNGDNNVSAGAVADGSTNDNTLDAENMDGVTQWWSSNSRADLVIEDIRIEDNQITKDITIGWSNADPSSVTSSGAGIIPADKVDFEVYFSPESLRKAAATSSSVLSLEVGNSVEVGKYDDAKPFVSIPYTNVAFNVNGTRVILTLNLTTPAVETRDQLWTAVQSAFNAEKATNTLLSDVTLTRSVNAATYVSTDGLQTRLADKFVMTKANGSLTAIPTLGWYADGGLPSDNAFNAYVRPGTGIIATDLITSTVILDNVGRESEAGDLVIGSMSTRTGVERFDITVENNANTSGEYTASGSWVGSMSSTNNFLREVKAKNNTAGAPSDYLYVGTGQDTANNNLTTIRQTFLSTQNSLAGRVAYQKAVDAALLNADGLVDVRLFDASAMTGQVKVGATITAASIQKYQDLYDDAADAGADDVAFNYTTGTGNDSMNIVLSGALLASNNNVVSGRGDFSFVANGGSGDDHIQVRVSDLTAATIWYQNQKINANITVNGGDGNDTIRTPGHGDKKIDGGAGNDTIYTDNTGIIALTSPTPTTAELEERAFNEGRAAFVFNIVDVTAGTAGIQNDAEDLLSQAAPTSYTGINAFVTVKFLDDNTTNNTDGYNTAKAYIGNTNGATTVSNATFSDLQVNQAIKKAINSDAVLNKLLVAEDGPGRTLIIKSLIDGAMTETDLVIAFGQDAATAVQTNAFTAASVTTPVLSTGGGSELENLGARYTTVFANDSTDQGNTTGGEYNGTDSTAETDNTITGGAGNDVIALSSSANAAETVVFATGFGSDTIVYAGSDDKMNFAGTWATNVDNTGAFSATLTNGSAFLVTTAGLDAAITTGTQTYADVNTLTVAQWEAAFNATSSAAGSSLLLIQNGANTDQYKVLTVTASAANVITEVVYMGEVELVGLTSTNIAGGTFIV
jgi:hypothetical protein